jgi:hypothetical protein
MTEPKNQKPSFIQVIWSVLAAMFGVQSQKARERDFQHGSPAAFIVVGLIAVTLFVLLLYGVVKWVMTLGIG